MAEDTSLEEIASVDAPMVRLTNAVFMNFDKGSARWMRLGPRLGVAFRKDDVWVPELRTSASRREALQRRMKVMASLPLGVGPKVLRATIQLRFGRGRVGYYGVWSRPCRSGECLLVGKVCPEDERPLREWEYGEGAVSMLGPEAEHAFRMARLRPEIGVELLTTLARRAGEAGPPGRVLQLEALYACANASIEIDQRARALDVLRRAEQLIADAWGPRTTYLAEGRKFRAQVLSEMGRHDSAVAVAEDALRPLPEFTMARFQQIGVLGEILRAAGRLDLAAERYDEAIELLIDFSGEADLGLAKLRSKRAACASLPASVS